MDPYCPVALELMEPMWRLGSGWVGFGLGSAGAVGGGPSAHGFGGNAMVGIRLGGIWVGVFEVLQVGDPQPMALVGIGLG